MSHSQEYTRRDGLSDLSDGIPGSQASKVPQYAVDALRAVLDRGEPISRENRQMCTDALLRRYLHDPAGRAAGATRPLAESERLLRETLDWRDETVNSRSLACLLCQRAGARAHCFDCVGVDGFNRPVLYGCPARSASQDVELIILHVMYALERVLAREPSKAGKEAFATQWVLLLDLRGFETKHVSVTLGLKLAHLVQVRYRGQLAHAYLFDAPQLFDVMYSPMVPAIAPSVKRCVEFVDSSDLQEVQRVLRLDQSVLQWLQSVFDSHPTRDPLPAIRKSEEGGTTTKHNRNHSTHAEEAGMVYAQEVGAWGRMAARQQRVEEAQLPAVDEVEQVLYDLSEEYGSPSCDEDLRAAALTLVTILSEPNNPAHRKRNPEYDESSDRSLAGSLSQVPGSPMLLSDSDESVDGAGAAPPLNTFAASRPDVYETQQLYQPLYQPQQGVQHTNDMSRRGSLPASGKSRKLLEALGAGRAGSFPNQAAFGRGDEMQAWKVDGLDASHLPAGGEWDNNTEAQNAMGRLARRKNKPEAPPSAPDPRDEEAQYMSDIPPVPELPSAQPDPALEDTRRRLQGLEQILSSLRDGALEDAMVSVAGMVYPPANGAAAQGETSDVGRASPASVVALNPAEQASSPRSGEVPHEAARKSPSARSSAALSSNREDRPPQVSGNASELSLLRASPGKPRHDGDARERISDAELHDQEPGEGGSVPAERESLRAAGIAPANGGHEVLQGEVKATSANKEGEASIVPQELPLPEYIIRLPRYTRSGDILRKSIPDYLPKMLDYRYQCLLYAIYYPLAATKVGHGLLSAATLLCQMVMLCSVSVGASYFENYGFFVALFLLFLGTVLAGTDALMSVPVTLLLLVVANAIVYQNDSLILAPLICSALASTLLVAWRMMDSTKPAQAGMLLAGRVFPSVNVPLATKIFAILPALLIEWIAAFQVLLVNLTFLRLSTKIAFPNWALEMDILLRVVRKLPKEEYSYPVGPPFNMTKYTVSTRRMLHLVETVFRLSCNALLVRLHPPKPEYEPQHFVDLFAVPTDVRFLGSPSFANMEQV